MDETKETIEEAKAYEEAGAEDEEVTEDVASLEDSEESAETDSTDSTVQETAADGLLYYTFRIQTDGSSLNLRRGPGTDTKVMARLSRTTVGYVLQPGNEWTKVYTEDGQKGYLASEYLIVDKVTAEDFPEDIRGKVEAPTEELTSAFEASG